MVSDDKLLPHRNAIDRIDREILELLNERAGHARAIGSLKGTGAVYRPEREAQVLRRIKQLNRGPLSDEGVARLFREVMSECLAVERPLTIAYLGPEGTFTQQAAIKHFGHAAATAACVTVDECMRLAESGQADYAVVPVENSTEGSVGRTLDLLVSSPLQACGEVVLRIHHQLMRRREGLDGVAKVCAHAQALAQCHDWLDKHLPDSVARVAVSSNGEAARLAAEDDAVLAVAGVTAAEIYGLTVLVRNIEDEPNNTTRFLVLGRQSAAPSGQDKTSLVFSTPNRAGAAFALLAPFERAGISMTKFESRPSKTGLWEYLFFIDIEGHRDDAGVAGVLEGLVSDNVFVKVLGSYPAAVL
ncbi:MAG: prephenate dehydratase [Neisseria sp.]|nr:prephenate dehydratase [Neisseria sp.]